MPIIDLAGQSVDGDQPGPAGIKRFGHVSLAAAAGYNWSPPSIVDSNGQRISPVNDADNPHGAPVAARRLMVHPQGVACVATITQWGYSNQTSFYADEEGCEENHSLITVRGLNVSPTSLRVASVKQVKPYGYVRQAVGTIMTTTTGDAVPILLTVEAANNWYWSDALGHGVCTFGEVEAKTRVYRFSPDMRSYQAGTGNTLVAGGDWMWAVDAAYDHIAVGTFGGEVVALHFNGTQFRRSASISSGLMHTIHVDSIAPNEFVFTGTRRAPNDQLDIVLVYVWHRGGGRFVVRNFVIDRIRPWSGWAFSWVSLAKDGTRPVAALTGYAWQQEGRPPDAGTDVPYHFTDTAYFALHSLPRHDGGTVEVRTRSRIDVLSMSDLGYLGGNNWHATGWRWFKSGIS